MDWNALYGVSRALTLEISRTGELMTAGSAGRRPMVLDLDGLPVLMAFAPAATPHLVFERLARDWEIEEGGFATVVEGLLEQGFLVVADDAAAQPERAPTSFDSLLVHHHLLRDVVRVTAYKAAIDRHCRGKSVVEIGCGSGLLSIFAARAGARRVVAIEEGRIAELAARMFQANGYAETIELRQANSLDVELDEPADVIIHEILGVDPLTENVLRYIQDARQRLLRPEGRLLPYRLEVFCAGLEVAEDRLGRDQARLLAEAADLAVLYGADFGPYLEMLAGLSPGAFRLSSFRQLGFGDSQNFPFAILSQECRLLDLDFRADAPIRAGRFSLRMLRRGTLGGIVLYFRAQLDEETRLTNSPFMPRTSWGWDIRPLSRQVAVREGDEATLAVQVESRFGRQRMEIDLLDE